MASSRTPMTPFRPPRKYSKERGSRSQARKKPPSRAAASKKTMRVKTEPCPQHPGHQEELEGIHALAMRASTSPLSFMEAISAAIAVAAPPDHDDAHQEGPQLPDHQLGQQLAEVVLGAVGGELTEDLDQGDALPGAPP